MLFIAHRGNLYGPDPKTENTTSQIEHVLHTTDYSIEIDVWCHNNKFYLGHDEPTIKINNAYDYLNNPRFFIHAKNLSALTHLTRVLNKPHIFSHDKDPVVLTYPRGFAWVYPGHPIDDYSICVMPETRSKMYKRSELFSCYGICTDYPVDYEIVYKGYRAALAEEVILAAK